MQHSNIQKLNGLQVEPSSTKDKMQQQET
jgi:hypothetical protein